MIKFPPEWVEQDAILLTWPHANTDWANQLEEVEHVYLELAKAILQDQSLIISCEDKSTLTRIDALLLPLAEQHQHRLRCLQIPADDTWARDHGPITVLKDEHPVLLDFNFNAWGDKYESGKDNLINRRLHQQGAFGNTPMESIDMILEGGSIETDGLGTLMTTERCLLSDTRNAALDKQRIEQQLKKELGIERVLWLSHGNLEGDDTDAHIDTLARFCTSDTICYVSCDDEQDPHYDELKQMEQQLKGFRRPNGEPYRLAALPMPDAIFHQNERLPATYANFLITNHSVLMPSYNQEKDAAAASVLQSCFPERHIVKIDCSPLIREHGSLHCVTMQIPKGVLS